MEFANRESNLEISIGLWARRVHKPLEGFGVDHPLELVLVSIEALFLECSDDLEQKRSITRCRSPR
ncbi:hypothetical protein C488_15257 [Natrinema pellirubrum DSM 15624]|uniref:Uncharacterized protein n=1 Tax=Natrinema pellirubrum (strain DSM 15624 / CIP 106293 / JCM 10476 / NCIMB 786 / 157) TaxID=797303 RepID=L9YDV7_NATP1|nr:hypothetical protein C488_15257 [Natrinema pellirubrum DSM 15624]